MHGLNKVFWSEIDASIEQGGTLKKVMAGAKEEASLLPTEFTTALKKGKRGWKFSHSESLPRAQHYRLDPGDLLACLSYFPHLEARKTWLDSGCD